MTDAAPNARSSEPSRTQIVAAFRDRLRNHCRTKLRLQERQALVVGFRERLIHMAQQGTDTPEAILALCQAEMALLLEGYPESTLTSAYLPPYRSVIHEAIASGALPLTSQNSYPLTPADRHEAIARRHYALDGLAALPTREPAPPTERPSHVDLDRFLAVTQALLVSLDPIDLLLGVLAVTGRLPMTVLALSHLRVTAVGSFNRLARHAHPYLLTFTPASQRPETLVTLQPATDVLAALSKLRVDPWIGQLDSTPTPQLPTVIEQIQRHAQRIFGLSRIVEPHRLQDLYGAIALHYFCPPHLPEHTFARHYLDALWERDAPAQSPRLRIRLLRQGKPLTATGVKLSEAGPLPFTTDLDEHPLQAVVSQLSRTVERQAATLAHLHAQTATGARVSELEQSLARAIAETEHWRAQWQAAHAELTQLQARLNAPGEVPPRQRGRPRTDPRHSSPYRRAQRIWDLTQQWNRAHPNSAIQLSKTLLGRHFGIHSAVLEAFFLDYADALQAENRRLGIHSGDTRFNQGDKQQAYLKHLKPILEQERLYR